jgi:AP2 domain
VRGVRWQKQIRRWVARVHHHGQEIHVGCFKTLAEAEAAAIAARRRLFTHNDVDRRPPVEPVQLELDIA